MTSCTYMSKTVNVEDFDRICRTCLSDEKICPIMETVINDLEAKELLEKIAEVNLGDSDESMPKNICESCLNELHRMYKFKKQCQNNEVILKMLIKNAETENVEEEEFSYKITVIEEDFKAEEEEEELSRDDSHPETETAAELAKIADLQRKLDKIARSKKKKKYTLRPKYKCEFCDKMFTKNKLKQHRRTHTKEQPFECEFCFRRFSLSCNLRRHKMTHTGERPHICKICGKGFIQAPSLHAHEKSHESGPYDTTRTNPEQYNCSFCGRGFKRYGPYATHLRKFHSDSSEEQNDQPENGSESRDYVCEVCARAYKSKHLLKAHRQTHGEKRFLCNVCGKGFNTNAALQSHLRVHTGEKPHTCTVCQKSFSHVGTFHSHMLIHQGVKPYTCSYCSKAFTQLSHLNYHLRTHSGEKPYSCSYCDKSFALRGNLRVHVRTHTGETPYVCPVCGKGFYDSSSMKKHHRNHKEVWMTDENGQPQRVEYDYEVKVVNCEKFQTQTQTVS